MFSQIKSIVLGVVLLISSTGVVAQSITGTTPVQLGQTWTYSYTSGSTVGDPQWTTTKGTVISTSSVGLTYSATINWTATGSATITFKNGSTTIATKSVTVNS